MRIIAGSQVAEDFDSYSRVQFSKLMSQGARRDEADEGFGYRHDDELVTLVNKGGTALTYEVNSANCPGFYNEMIVVLNHWPAFFLNLSIYLQNTWVI